jgi:hypothetical protein
LSDGILFLEPIVVGDGGCQRVQDIRLRLLDLESFVLSVSSGPNQELVQLQLRKRCFIQAESIHSVLIELGQLLEAPIHDVARERVGRIRWLDVGEIIFHQICNDLRRAESTDSTIHGGGHRLSCSIWRLNHIPDASGDTFHLESLTPKIEVNWRGSVEDLGVG